MLRLSLSLSLSLSSPCVLARYLSVPTERCVPRVHTLPHAGAREGGSSLFGAGFSGKLSRLVSAHAAVGLVSCGALTTKAVECAALATEGIDHIHSGQRLATCVLAVHDRVTDDILNCRTRETRASLSAEVAGVVQGSRCITYGTLSARHASPRRLCTREGKGQSA